MKRVLIVIGVVILLMGVTFGVLVYTDVLHEHVYADATCDKPETCIKCQKTRGREKLHDWKYATCEEAQVCKSCGYVRGEALGHDWKKATCDKPQICKACNKKKGKALGHKWEEATCSRPKTCKVCDKEQGTSLGHTVNFGKCSKCGVLVNKDRVHSIVSPIKDMYKRLKHITDEVIKVSFDYSINDDEMLDALWEIYSESDVDGTYFVNDAKKIIEQCGDYSELSGIKNDMLYIRDNPLPELPDKANITSESMMNYIKKVDEIIRHYNNSFIAIENIVNTYEY